MARKRRARKTVKVSRKVKKSSGAKRIRPVIIKVGGKYKRPKKSRTFSKATMINPKRKKSRKRRTRHNPGFNLKRTFNRNNIATLGTISIGLVAWPYLKGMVKRSISDNSALASMERYVGIIPIISGLLLLTMSKKQSMKNVGIGIGAFGLFDIIATNVPQLKLTAPDAALGASYMSVGASYPAALGAAVSVPESKQYGRPPEVSHHYLQTSGTEENPYGDVQW